MDKICTINLFGINYKAQEIFGRYSAKENQYIFDTVRYVIVSSEHSYKLKYCFSKMTIYNKICQIQSNKQKYNDYVNNATNILKNANNFGHDLIMDDLLDFAKVRWLNFEINYYDYIKRVQGFYTKCNDKILFDAEFIDIDKENNCLAFDTKEEAINRFEIEFKKYQMII